MREVRVTCAGRKDSQQSAAQVMLKVGGKNPVIKSLINPLSLPEDPSLHH